MLFFRDARRYGIYFIVISTSATIVSHLLFLKVDAMNLSARALVISIPVGILIGGIGAAVVLNLLLPIKEIK